MLVCLVQTGRFSLYTLCFFFFNDTATTEIYTLSLHDALPICGEVDGIRSRDTAVGQAPGAKRDGDRKSTRLNSSHLVISYAVFCLKKKKNMPNAPSIVGAIDTPTALLGFGSLRGYGTVFTRRE